MQNNSVDNLIDEMVGNNEESFNVSLASSDRLKASENLSSKDDFELHGQNHEINYFQQQQDKLDNDLDYPIVPRRTG